MQLPQEYMWAHGRQCTPECAITWGTSRIQLRKSIWTSNSSSSNFHTHKPGAAFPRFFRPHRLFLSEDKSQIIQKKNGMTPYNLMLSTPTPGNPVDLNSDNSISSILSLLPYHLEQSSSINKTTHTGGDKGKPKQNASICAVYFEQQLTLQSARLNESNYSRVWKKWDSPNKTMSQKWKQVIWWFAASSQHGRPKDKQVRVLRDKQIIVPESWNVHILIRANFNLDFFWWR